MTSKESADSRSGALVIFGLTGDLGEKKLFPAIYELAAADRLGVPVIGVGRSDYSDDELRQQFRDAMRDHHPADGAEVDTALIDSIELTYLSGDSTEASTFDELAVRLGDVVAPLVYAALPPHLFGAVATAMTTSDFADDSRLMLEKPFGDDVESARGLWADITDVVSPERTFVVDHFLAKAAIENMTVVRHANPLMANSLDAAHVASIEVTMSEEGGVDGRGSFYDGVGAVADVVQSHVLQMMAMALMEAPASAHRDDVRAVRCDLLASVEPVDPATVTLGQYDGYRDHDGVADDSTVETFVSMSLAVDNDRWRGVPISLRAGKHLERTATSVEFTLVDTAPASAETVNRVRFEVKPSPSVVFDLAVLDADDHQLRTTSMYACGPDTHGPLGDYATMFDHACDGNHRHFAHIDGIVEAWRILAPIDDADIELRTYEPGSSGPTD